MAYNPKRCDICDDRGTILVEGGFFLCDYHGTGPKAGVTKYICKHCKVRVVSRSDLHAVLGKEHKRSCPRSKTFRQ